MASGATTSVGATMAPSTKPTAERHAEQIMRDRRHRAGGEEDAAEREQRDRAQVETEFAPAHGDAGRIDQRRQDAEQHQFRRQRNPRQAGNERQRNAGDDQKDGRRGIEPARDHGDDHQHREQQQDGLDRRRHGSQNGWLDYLSQGVYKREVSPASQALAEHYPCV